MMILGQIIKIQSKVMLQIGLIIIFVIGFLLNNLWANWF